MMEGYLTTNQAGERLQVSRKMIIKLINEGRITAEKVGRDYFIQVSEIARYQRNRKRAGRPSTKKSVRKS
jgi:excisionase family DNA binding protein